MPSFAAIAVVPSPSAAASTIRARIANPLADVVRRAHATTSGLGRDGLAAAARLGWGHE
jgi:hypothetical protein